MRHAPAILAIAILTALGLSAQAFANSISSVEHARAKERAGYDLTDEDVGNLRRYGAESDRGGYGDRYGYDDDDDDDDDIDDDDDGFDDEPGVGVSSDSGDPNFDDDF